jgi:hypothetical protein
VPAPVRVRMACALGAVFGALMRWGDSFSDIDPDDLGVMVREAVDDLLRPALSPVGRGVRPGRRPRPGGRTARS